MPNLMDLLHNQYVAYYIFAAIIAYPMTLILKRAGLPRTWAATLAVPMLGFTICMGLMTFNRWPALLGEKD